MVEAPQYAVSVARICNVWSARVRRNVASLSSAHRMPIAKCDLAVIAAAGSFGGAAILLGAIHVIRKLIIGGHVIKLRRRLVEPRAPGFGAIHAYGGALIAAKNHALGILRIDPQAVIVVAARRAFDRLKIF